MSKRIRNMFKRRPHEELDYENIVMDSLNLPKYDRNKMEGVIERSITREAFMAIIVVFALIMLVYISKLAFLQIVHGQEYRDIAENNRLSSEVIFNKRGIIYDRNGTELAWNVFTDDRDFPLRRYYEGPGLAHLLGYVSYPQQDSSGKYFSTEYTGISGLEYAYGDRLNGQLGRKVREVDALGRTVASYAIEQPVPGENIYLSIDSRLQEQLNRILADYVEEQGFVGAAGVIMNAETGQMVVMTSVPEYDNNVLADGRDRATIAGYNTDTRLPFLNRVSGGSFAPGSIVKVFIAAGLMDKNIVDPNYKLFTDGTLEVENQYGGGYTVFRDARNNGYVNLYDAIARSSNIYFMTFGGGFKEHRGLGINGMVDYLTRFGLGEKTGIAEFREQSGNVPSPEWKRETFDAGWLLADTYFTAIGQYAFLANPLQAAVATAAIANGGDVLVPKLEIKSDREVRKELGIADEDLQIVRDAMRQTVLRGTTQSLNQSFVEVAAKSGTAERGVSNNLVNSWAIGFWPYDDPQYVFAVMAEQGPRDYDYSVSRVMTRLLIWMEENEIEGYY